MQDRILLTNFDDRYLFQQVRHAKRRALHAIHAAHVDGKIGREERDEQSAAVQQSFDAAFNNARRITFLSDCDAIERYYRQLGGSHE